jgi:hypothetical protein
LRQGNGSCEKDEKKRKKKPPGIRESRDRRASASWGRASARGMRSGRAGGARRIARPS